MLLDKVTWQEGMLLRPQHLQHNDRYYHQQLARRSQLSQGYAWGFLTLEIDPQYLEMARWWSARPVACCLMGRCSICVT